MGFLSHAGHTYNCRTEADIIHISETSLKILKDLKKRFIKDYPNCIISLGDTPGCSVAENFEGVDEVRPGNFVFYDLTQHLIGSNSMDEIAVAVACPIVAIHEDKHKIIVFGGGVHFSKERLEDPELGVIYGQVVRHEGLKWTKPIPNMYVSALSQEHGTIHVPEAEILNYRIGDYLVVLPVHSCMTANLMNSYLNVNINRPIFHL
jgi:D-serine deaminase-like pyridoxal phosphate-dependent protein